MKSLLKRGVTLLELLVVLVIISILSTIAMGVYSREIQRAKYARARQEIRTLEVAIAQYEVDTGQIPPSGSGNVTGGIYSPNAGVIFEGTGALQLAIRSSLSGNFRQPLSTRWKGPYIDWDYNRMGDINGNPITSAPGDNANVGAISFLDPWGNPYAYVRSADYAQNGSGAELPVTSPFAASETYYNPSTYQIYSRGADGTTLPAPQRGVDIDDVTNFRSAEN